jgi:hypothetical protein
VWRQQGAEYGIALSPVDHWTPEVAQELLSDRPLGQWVDLATPFREQLARTV